MKKLLFIDRDGTLVVEPPITEQIDSFEQVEFLPRVIQNLSFIRHTLDFDFIIVSNQDGLGTDANPRDNFEKLNDLILRTFHTEGVDFDEQYYDEHYPEDNHPNRKPGTGMLTKFIEGNGTEYDLANSFVIGDRMSDVQLAKNLGSKAILLSQEDIKDADIALVAKDWDQIAAFLFAGERRAEVRRTTKETDIDIKIDLDGTGHTEISTGLGFFDHMLEQIGKHSGMDLTIKVKGDLNVDEHHTIEDVAIALGTAINELWRTRKLINRYGYEFNLTMDDCLASVAMDLGGRPWLVFDADFRREKIGDFPAEMIYHFFKSLSDNAKCNLSIKATGTNEHHKLEGIFKALAKCLKHAISYDFTLQEIPSSKGML